MILLFDCLICPHCCKILLGDVRRIFVAFTDDKVQETGLQAIILNAASLVPKFRHYLNPIEIARAIQLCRFNLAWLIICKL